MANELWGAAAGLQSLVQDTDQHALAQMQLEEGQARIGLETVQMQQAQETLSKQHQLQGDLAALQKVWSAEKKPDAMDQATWQVQQRAKHMQDMSEKYIADGFPDQGFTFMQASGEMEYRQSEIDKNRAEIKFKQWDQGLKILNTVHDDASLQAAIQQWQQLNPGQPPPVQPGTKYSDRLKQTLSELGMNEMEKAQADQARASAIQNRARARLDAAYADKAEADAQWTNRNRPTMGKAGVVNLSKLPTAPEQKLAVDLIMQSFPVGSSDSAARGKVDAAGERMSEIARGIMAQNPGMQWSEATRRALPIVEGSGMLGGLRPRHVPAGTSYSVPIDLTISGAIAPTKENLKDNMYYRIPMKGEKDPQTVLVIKGKDGHTYFMGEKDFKQWGEQLSTMGSSAQLQGGTLSPDELEAYKAAHPVPEPGTGDPRAPFDTYFNIPGNID